MTKVRTIPLQLKSSPIGNCHNHSKFNFKTCITFDSVGILRWGFQHFGFLIIVILIMKSFKKVFEDSKDL